MNRTICERALAGDRFDDIFIADCHCHMGNWYDFYFPTAGIDQMLQDAARLSINEIYVAPHAALSCDYKLGNAQISAAMHTRRGMVFAYLVLNPNKGDEIDAQFAQYYADPGFVGVKIHPGLHDYAINGENYRAVFDKVHTHGGFILAHTWETHKHCTLGLCKEMLQAYPDVALILGHAGGTGPGVRKAIELVNTLENAYLDTSGFEFSNVWIETIAAQAAPDKILFGSDYPFHDLRSGLARILFADLDDHLKLAILGQNFQALLGKYGKTNG